MKTYLIHYLVPWGELGVITQVVVAYTEEQARSLGSRHGKGKEYKVLYVHEVDSSNTKPRVEAEISWITQAKPL